MTAGPRAASVSALLLVVLALALTACSAPAQAGPQATSDWSDSPLNVYLAPVWGTDLEQADYDAQNARVEELVAACMTDAGFDYIPRDDFGSVGPDDEWTPDDPDWVAQWGYGAVEYPGQDSDGAAYADPNEDYVQSLGEAEAAAYWEQLYGPQPTEEELAANDGTWTPTWEEQGCNGAAYHEVHGDDATAQPENKPVMDALNDFYTAEQDDPALAEVDADWADCMASAGRDGFAKQADASQSIYDALNQLYNETEDSTDRTVELDALHEREVALALDDLDCRTSTDYRMRSLEVQWAAEERFIADHRTELDALVADAEAARAAAGAAG